MTRRVVVTGLGLVTPLGCGVDVNWSRLIKGDNGCKTIEHFETEDLACKIAATIPLEGEGAYNPNDWMKPKDQRKVDDFIIYAIAAADMALQDSGWSAKNEQEKDRAGVLVGSGIGGLQGIEKAAHILAEKGGRKISPFFIPGRLINLAGGQISIRHGLRGPNHAVVTACSTGSHAIGDAGRLIAHGDADIMVAGGTESPICRLALAGFASAKALSTNFNETPQKASRPYDQDRDGFVMGEGAGIVVLEELEHAKARGAKIYGELIGYGLSGDAYHITAPAPDGNGAYRCMKAALDNAGIKPTEIDYINAHGTSTPMGDELELKAVERLFDGVEEGLYMSSTKSAIGHLLGAAGAVEAVYSILAMEHNQLPPTLNLDNPSIETKIDLVANKSKQAEIKTVLSNSFGFGGTNASLIFRQI